PSATTHPSHSFPTRRSSDLEIVRIAAALLGREETRQRERGAYDVVLVDEYQDSDPAQESLLMALAGDGRELIAVGDPDQSIYALDRKSTRLNSSHVSISYAV